MAIMEEEEGISQQVMTMVTMEGAEDNKECEIKLVMTTVTMEGTSSISVTISKDILVALTTMAEEESIL